MTGMGGYGGMGCLDLGLFLISFFNDVEETTLF